MSAISGSVPTRADIVNLHGRTDRGLTRKSAINSAGIRNTRYCRAVVATIRPTAESQGLRESTPSTTSAIPSSDNMSVNTNTDKPTKYGFKTITPSARSAMGAERTCRRMANHQTVAAPHAMNGDNRRRAGVEKPATWPQAE